MGVYARRVEGILAGFADSEVRDVRIIHSPTSRAGAAKALGSALDERSADLVVAVCDRLALGANIELTRRGVNVPGEVALSGLGDVAIARRLTPSLTTYSLPYASAAADIARLILSQEGEALRSVELRGELVVRESTTLKPNATTR